MNNLLKGKIHQKKKTTIYSLLMLLTAILWGFGFVVQSIAMNSIEPITFNGIRNLTGSLTIFLVSLVMTATEKRKRAADDSSDVADAQALSPQQKRKNRRTLVTGGICCGVCLFAAGTLQQTGLVYTTPGKAGFITALYIVLVPVLGLFFHKKVSKRSWFGVAIAVVGLYLLCVTESFTIEKGDFLVLLCAFGYSAHILCVDYFSKKADCIKLSYLQFLVCGILSIPFMFLFEHPTLSAIRQSVLTIGYAGIFSCGVAFTLQTVSQKHLNPTVASLLMSLESCFAAIFGWLVLKQTMSPRELLGVLFMAIAIVLAQI